MGTYETREQRDRALEALRQPPLIVPSGSDPINEWVNLVEEKVLRAKIAAEIAAHADDDSDVSDAYRHAALIATQGGNR